MLQMRRRCYASGLSCPCGDSRTGRSASRHRPPIRLLCRDDANPIAGEGDRAESSFPARRGCSIPARAGMYQVANTGALAKGGRALVGRRNGVFVSRTVILLGLTSLFTDISSEMVTAVLPLYIVFSLGMSPLQFGIIDGIQQGASSLVRVVAGYTADRFGRYKDVA